MESSPTQTAPSSPIGQSGQVVPETQVEKSRSFFGNLIALLVILLPVVACAWLVKTYVVNSPHYDDLTFSQDWIDYKNGQLTLAKLFSVHLEHRVTVPRTMALVAHILGGADLRWQNAMTLVLLVGVLWNLVVLWKRTTGATLRQSWFPLLLMSSVLFCAVQWQMLLWPILFEIIVPIFCITMMLRLWASRMDPWIVLPINLLLAGFSMLSFANGPIVLCSIAICIWCQRPYLAKSDKWMLTLGWLIGATIEVALYFTNFHNSAPKQFAYWYGKDMTAKDTIGAFFTNPDMSVMDKAYKAVSFIFGVLGSHLSRGLHQNNLFASQIIGLICVVLFAIAVIWVLTRRKDKELLRHASPWIILGLFSGGTATFIMLGRVARTISGTIAITPRYMTHSVPLTLGLIALFWILGHRLTPRWRTWGAMIGGLFLMLTLIEWSYGMQRMGLWQNARLQGKALLMFSKVFEPYGYLGQVSGIGDDGAEIMKDLDAVGQSPFPLLTTRVINQKPFHISDLKLRHRQAGFNALNFTADQKGLQAHGFAELPSQRPADLILFTKKNDKGEDEIFGLEYLVRYPDYLISATMKDDDWLSILPMKSDYYARWEGPVNLYKNEIPPPGTEIRCWALDVEKMYVYAIPDNRLSPDPQPPIPPLAPDEK